MKSKKARDLEKTYPRAQFIQKLRRLADALEQDQAFTIQIAQDRVTIPARAIVNIEHERNATSEEIEFQIKWQRSKK